GANRSLTSKLLLAPFVKILSGQLCGVPRMPDRIHQPEVLAITISFGIRGTPRPYNMLKFRLCCRISAHCLPTPMPA
ncbi:MAG: hypothetical protein K2G41_00050, partial [Duncaniella sp.]|uniref:hypothetical protein n=1 Tax=Duncaniella sp. TaxID=2518496 RepID=UPI0023CCD2BE